MNKEEYYKAVSNELDTYNWNNKGNLLFQLDETLDNINNDNIAEVRGDLEWYSYEFYNMQRPHSTLKNMSPYEYSKENNLFY